MTQTILEGSERSLTVPRHPLGHLRRQQDIGVTLHIKSNNGAAGNTLNAFAASLVSEVPRERRHLSRAEFATRFGATNDDFRKIRQFVREYGLRVVADRVTARTSASQRAHRSLEVRGPVAAFNQAFGVRLMEVGQGRNIYRTYEGPLSVPEKYQSVIQNVFGLDTQPQAAPRFRSLPHLGGYNPHAWQAGFQPDEIAKLYKFPEGTSGAGQTIAIVELGGGFRRHDLRKYFKSRGLPLPKVRSVGVAGAANAPDGNPGSADAEVMLDIEVAGAVAPGARLVVYFAPNTSRGFFRAMNAAVHDDRYQPSIISVSWGGPESSWTLRDMQSIDEVCQAAAVIGTSVFVAAGDGGSTDGVEGVLAHVDFPASSPNVTSCGGTMIATSEDGEIQSETVWNDGRTGGGTGGGISEAFPIPAYQMGPGIAVPVSVNPSQESGRGVPDIAGNAAPLTGYRVRIDGVDTVIGGTSAVAPLWAGLFARINESLGKPVGFVNTLLYSVISAAPGALRDITDGSNDVTGEIGAYSARVGWDPCTGLGSPADATKILNILKSIS